MRRPPPTCSGASSSCPASGPRAEGSRKGVIGVSTIGVTANTANFILCTGTFVYIFLRAVLDAPVPEYGFDENIY